MSRSGYHDDYENWSLIRWRGAVASAFRGTRGQAFLREMAAALDAMPVKALAANSLEETDTGAVCALGAVGKARGLDLAALDPENSEGVAASFGIANAMACEIVYYNDEGTWYPETPEQRFIRMREWVAAAIRTGEP